MRKTAIVATFVLASLFALPAQANVGAAVGGSVKAMQETAASGSQLVEVRHRHRHHRRHHRHYRGRGYAYGYYPRLYYVPRFYGFHQHHHRRHFGHFGGHHGGHHGHH